MPWEKKTVMEQREEFLQEVAAGRATMSALCRKYGISRKTGYKWVHRAEAGLPLADASRRPHRQPAKTPPEIEQKILEVRQDHPVWGGKMICAVLESAGFDELPSAKTCCNILKRNGCIDPLESKKHQPCQRFEREKCNELWQMDFKGDFLLGDNTRCYPLDILDDHSRFCLKIDPKPNTFGTIETVTATFREFGLPDAILCDNGAQFAGFRGGYAQFERFLMDLDIWPIHGRIMHPQTQGKIERFHRTMKQEALREQPANLEEAKAILEDFRFRYNEVRPHSALGMRPPAAVYKASERSYVEPKPFVYDAGARVVKVNNWGYLRFGPITLYLSETMRDTYLEIRPDPAPGKEDHFLVIYRNFKIARVDAKNQILLNRHIRKL
jgi:transposase InsO family protein